jgi:hypothetical protein
VEKEEEVAAVVVMRTSALSPTSPETPPAAATRPHQAVTRQQPSAHSHPAKIIAIAPHPALLALQPRQTRGNASYRAHPAAALLPPWTIVRTPRQ